MTDPFAALDTGMKRLTISSGKEFSLSVSADLGDVGKGDHTKLIIVLKDVISMLEACQDGRYTVIEKEEDFEKLF